MAGKLGNITFDCADPTALATFWADVFGYPHPELPDELRQAFLASGYTEEDIAAKSAIEDPTGEGPRLFFQKVPEPKTAKNRMHIDLRATPGHRPSDDEIAAERDRIVALGAVELREVREGSGPALEHFFVMQDPEGNEFCID